MDSRSTLREMVIDIGNGFKKYVQRNGNWYRKWIQEVRLEKW